MFLFSTRIALYSLVIFSHAATQPRLQTTPRILQSRLTTLPTPQAAIPNAEFNANVLRLREKIKSASTPSDLALALDPLWHYQTPAFITATIEDVCLAIEQQADAEGRVTPGLQAAISTIEGMHHDKYSRDAIRRWQATLAKIGAETSLKIDIPLDGTPYWQRIANELRNWGSVAELPADTDILIVGAGLTGAAAGYHAERLSRFSGKNVNITILEQGPEPASGSSGRNGGHHQLIPENALGFKAFNGLARHYYHQLKKQYPRKTKKHLQSEAKRLALNILRLTQRNREIFLKTVKDENLDVDLSLQGVLRVAETGRQMAAMQEDLRLGNELDTPMRILSPTEVDEQLGRRVGSAKFGALWSEGGNYHPVKYVVGLLSKAIDQGVELFTNTKALTIEPNGKGYMVRTDRGDIKARKIILATDAFTSELIPQLAINAHRSQIMTLEQFPDILEGQTLTAHDPNDRNAGGIYTHVHKERFDSKRGTLIFGGGPEYPINPRNLHLSFKAHQGLLANIIRYFPFAVGIPPSSEWAGLIAHTPDQLPAIGRWAKDFFVSAGFLGYGGSWTQVAGFISAHLAVTGHVPDWFMPVEKVLSPLRPSLQRKKGARL